MQIDKLVHKVVFHLHETFANNVRVCRAPGPFCVKENGYGQFEMNIEIYFVGGNGDEEQQKYSLTYFLELPVGNSMQPLNRVRKEKISFLNPSPALRRILIECGATVKSSNSTLTRTTPSAITPPPPPFTSLNLKKSLNSASGGGSSTSLLSNISSAIMTNNNRHSINGSASGSLTSSTSKQLNNNNNQNHGNELSSSVIGNKKKLNDSLVNGANNSNTNANRKVCLIYSLISYMEFFLMIKKGFSREKHTPRLIYLADTVIDFKKVELKIKVY